MDMLDYIVDMSLIDYLDKRVMILLRDGRTLIGIFRSFDQFSNIVLHNTIERKVFKQSYYDSPLGLFVIRGENIAILGDMDSQREQSINLTHITTEEIKNIEPSIVHQYDIFDQELP